MNGKIQPRNLAGFIELTPQDQIVFNNMIDVIRKTYETFGFVPVDTPILEYSDVLLAKAGGETEKQIYRFTKGDNDISMRFDLTVPLAKYVAMHYGELTFPFRRYQIGKVYRGEKTQKGRFREFYQADIDVIGDESLSLMTDAEMPSIIYFIFNKLGFKAFKIKINNRKILNGLFEALGLKDNKIEVLRIIDKIDKVGEESVKEMLTDLELSENTINLILKFITIAGTTDERIMAAKNLGISNDQYLEGIDEIEKVVAGIRGFNVPEENFVVDYKIARGLDYYTGTVYETILDDYPEIGSVCSGGRYDNLSEFYTNRKLPGVGISIGLSRLFYKLNEANFFAKDSKTTSKFMILPMTEQMDNAFTLSTFLRQNGQNTEVNYTKKSVKSMLNYANKLQIPYVIFIGEEEIASDIYTVKSMNTGEQLKLSKDDILSLQ